MKILKAKSISSAFTKIKRLISSWPGKTDSYFWFRGSKDNRLSLLPGAYWRTDYDEKSVLLEFAQEGAMYEKVGDPYSWDTYYMAQHHGIPTRLLDWTESFSASLFVSEQSLGNRSTLLSLTGKFVVGFHFHDQIPSAVFID